MSPEEEADRESLKVALAAIYATPADVRADLAAKLRAVAVAIRGMDRARSQSFDEVANTIDSGTGWVGMPRGASISRP